MISRLAGHPLLRCAAVSAEMFVAACGRVGDRDGRPVYHVSIDSIRSDIERWGLPDVAETPNAYMSDFFGIQRLSDALTAQRVLSDLGPSSGGQIETQSDGVLRIRLDWGPAAEFHFGAIIELSGKRTVPLTFVALNGQDIENPSELGRQFRDHLEQHGLTETYLETNPYHEDESLAFETMRDTAESLVVNELAGFERFLQESRAMYLLPDNVHGNQERYDILMEMLEAEEVDWVAIEMLEVGLQDELQVLIEGEPGSPSYAAAERAILDFYQRNWNDAFGLEEPRNNHYFAVLQRAKNLGKTAYALDVSLDYQLFRYGEFPLGGVARNVIWARQIPRTGRGLVFGGSAHMNRGQKGSFQYFVKRLDPELPIYHYYVDNPPTR